MTSIKRERLLVAQIGLFILSYVAMDVAQMPNCMR